MFDHCIFFNLVTLSRKVNRIWQKEFESLGLTPSHGYLLFAMKESPNATQKELGELMELDASNITRLIDSLEIKGLIVKKSRGKGAEIILTTKGQRTYRSVKKTMDSLYKKMQVYFGSRYFKRLVNSLHRAKVVIINKI